MNQAKVKLFRPVFPDKISFRKFKGLYAHAPLEKRLELTEMAEKIKKSGPINHVRIGDGPDA